MLPKDPNFGIFSDTSGRITETYQIEWSRVYEIFDNDKFSDIQDNQLAYKRIRDSRLHSLAARPAILPYNEVVKWIVEHADPKSHCLNNSRGLEIANFRPKLFTKAYALKMVRQPLTTEFAQTSKSRFNFEEMLKSWMHQPSKFSKRSDKLYPVTWFKEPYSLFAAMLCILYAFLIVMCSRMNGLQ